MARSSAYLILAKPNVTRFNTAGQPQLGRVSDPNASFDATTIKGQQRFKPILEKIREFAGCLRLEPLALTSRGLVETVPLNHGQTQTASYAMTNLLEDELPPAHATLNPLGDGARVSGFEELLAAWKQREDECGDPFDARTGIIDVAELETHRGLLSSVNAEIAPLLIELYCRAGITGLGDALGYWLRREEKQPAIAAAAFAKAVTLTRVETANVAGALQSRLQRELSYQTRDNTARILANELVCSLTAIGGTEGRAMVRSQLSNIDLITAAVAFETYTRALQQRRIRSTTEELGAWYQAARQHVQRFHIEKPSDRHGAILLPALRGMAATRPLDARADLVDYFVQAGTEGAERLAAIYAVPLRELRQSGMSIGDELSRVLASRPGVATRLLTYLL